MTQRTREVFDQTAATYDPARARLIPGFDRFYRAAVELIPANTQHILDLGAGTGLLSAFLRQRLPNAHITLVDNSAPMLAQARDRFAKDPNLTCILADYTTFTAAEPFDAVVSALSIHHLDDAAKQQLFTRILTLLRPGAPFINAEQILAPTPALEAQAKADWLAAVRALGATPEQIEASLLRQTEDRCATVADQLLWLAQAGFAHPTCAFAQGRFAVLHATRPGSFMNSALACCPLA